MRSFLLLIGLVISCITAITIKSLDGDEWNVQSADGKYVLKNVTVPSSLYHQLFLKGIIEEPYHRFNVDRYRWVADTDWAYTYTGQISNVGVTQLECEGLDTIAKIYVDDTLVGHSDNMFIKYTFDITNALHKGTDMHTIRIDFTSPTKYAVNAATKYPYFLPSADIQSLNAPFRNLIRKEQCSFGWDWGPVSMTPIFIANNITCLGFP